MRTLPLPPAPRPPRAATRPPGRTRGLALGIPRLALGLGLLLASPAAVAAEVTDLPGELQGKVAITYRGMHHRGALIEQGEPVADRRITRHDLTYRLEFSPVLGVAVVLDLDHTPSLRHHHPDARTMLLDPISGGGSYLGSQGTRDHTIEASGLVGMWIGAAISPFNEAYAKGHRSTWRIDAAFRTPSPKRNLWTAPDGRRGAAPGGSALRLQSAFSSQLGVGNPWLAFSWVHETPLTVDVIDEDGATWAEGLRLHPASTVDLTAGVELVAFERPAQGARFAVDLFLGAAYRSFEDAASGIYLPHVLPASSRIPVTVGEQLEARAGFALDAHLAPWIRARTGPDLRLQTPFRPEHVYEARTRDKNLTVGWVFRLEGHLDARALQGS